jgi:hypothetical protein
MRHSLDKFQSISASPACHIIISTSFAMRAASANAASRRTSASAAARSSSRLFRAAAACRRPSLPRCTLCSRTAASACRCASPTSLTAPSLRGGPASTTTAAAAAPPSPAAGGSSVPASFSRANAASMGAGSPPFEPWMCSRTSTPPPSAGGRGGGHSNGASAQSSSASLSIPAGGAGAGAGAGVSRPPAREEASPLPAALAALAASRSCFLRSRSSSRRAF